MYTCMYMWITQSDRCIVHTQFKAVGIGEEFRQIEELGNKLLDVSHVGLTGGSPGVRDAVEQPVGEIKMAALIKE